jgi:hypothetical protein
VPARADGIETKPKANAPNIATVNLFFIIVSLTANEEESAPILSD